MFKFLLITFVIIYIFYKISTFLLKKVIKNGSRNFDSKKKKNDGILDKEGEYVKKWVPELINMPKKFVHKPWELNDSNILKLGSDYPMPIVSHEKARAAALSAFKSI